MPREGLCCLTLLRSIPYFPLSLLYLLHELPGRQAEEKVSVPGVIFCKSDWVRLYETSVTKAFIKTCIGIEETKTMEHFGISKQSPRNRKSED